MSWHTCHLCLRSKQSRLEKGMLYGSDVREREAAAARREGYDERHEFTQAVG